jgi:hypothetical protein
LLCVHGRHTVSYMGFLSNLTGAPDPRILERGRPGRGLILDMTPTGTTIASDDGIDEAVCIFILEVRHPRTPAYHVTTRQRFPRGRLCEIEPGQTLVAVRVDTANPSHVAIDWDAPVIVTAAL